MANYTGSVHWIYPLPNNMDFHSLYMCNLCSALVGKDSRRAHETFHDTYTNDTEIEIMSAVAWCDTGNHAFKAGEKGSSHFTGVVYDDDGNPQSKSMDACAEHSFQQTAAKAISQNASPSVQDGPPIQRTNPDVQPPMGQAATP